MLSRTVKTWWEMCTVASAAVQSAWELWKNLQTYVSIKHITCYTCVKHNGCPYTWLLLDFRSSMMFWNCVLQLLSFLKESLLVNLFLQDFTLLQSFSYNFSTSLYQCSTYWVNDAIWVYRNSCNVQVNFPYIACSIHVSLPHLCKWRSSTIYWYWIAYTEKHWLKHSVWYSSCALLDKCTWCQIRVMNHYFLIWLPLCWTFSVCLIPVQK